jgi:hypothetical protein
MGRYNPFYIATISKRLVNLLLLALLPLTSCKSVPEREQRYQAAYDAASKLPTFPYAASGLRFGMDSTQVQQHLDSLRQRDELNWQLSTGRLPIEAEPEYVKGKLVKLQLTLGTTGLPNSPEYRELVSGLTQAYGPGYVHGLGEDDDAQSWFKGGTEIELTPWVGVGFTLEYTDLHQAHALTLQLLRRDSLQLEQMKRNR